MRNHKDANLAQWQELFSNLLKPCPIKTKNKTNFKLTLKNISLK